MTNNQIRNKEAEQNNANNIRKNVNEATRNKEYERSNKQQEKLKREDQRIKKVETAGKIVNDAFGNLVGGAKAIGTFANDPSWYRLNVNLVRDAASISYHTPLTTYLTNKQLGTNVIRPRASVVCLRTQLSPGIGGTNISETATANSIYNSTVRVAAQNMYAWVRHANSGASNYESSDLMMYILAMDAAYALYAWGRSIYRMANSATSYNYTWLEDIAAGTSFNIGDFRENLANMRTFLNLTAARLNSLSVPNNLPYFNRHVWMFSNIFKDAAVKRSSYYVFYPNSFGTYVPTQARIHYAPLPAAMTFATFVSTVNSVVDALISDEDIGIISGDIRKAYGSDSLFKIEATPDNDYVEPFFSEEVLTQISGATLVGPLKDGSYDICQTYNGYIYQGTFHEEATFPALNELYPNITSNEGSSYSHVGFVINQYTDEPSPDDNMVATRLMAATDAPTIGTTVYRLVTLVGSEFITTATIVYYLDGDTRSMATLQDYSMRNANAARILPQLDWFPQFICNLDSSATTEYYYYISDLNNYAVIGIEELRNMHSVALLSLYAIPQEGMR